MFGTQFLNAQQIAQKLGISYTYFFKVLKRGGNCPYHQLGNDRRKYYVLEEVEHWLLESTQK